MLNVSRVEPARRRTSATSPRRIELAPVKANAPLNDVFSGDAVFSGGAAIARPRTRASFFISTLVSIAICPDTTPAVLLRRLDVLTDALPSSTGALAGDSSNERGPGEAVCGSSERSAPEAFATRWLVKSTIERTGYTNVGPKNPLVRSATLVAPAMVLVGGSVA